MSDNQVPPVPPKLAVIEQCTVCAGPLVDNTCDACAVSYHGTAGQELWQACSAIDQWHEVRHGLLTDIFARAHAAQVEPAGSDTAVTTTETLSQVTTSSTSQDSPTALVTDSVPSSAHPAAPQPQPQPQPSFFRRLVGHVSAEKLLIGLGALLVCAAAIVFVATSWSVLNLTGRSVTLGTLTVIFASIAHFLRNRRVPLSAEAFATIASTSLLADVVALGWVMGLSGDNLVYYVTAVACLCTTLFRAGVSWSKFTTYQVMTGVTLPVSAAMLMWTTMIAARHAGLLGFSWAPLLTATLFATSAVAATALVRWSVLATLPVTVQTLKIVRWVVAPLFVLPTGVFAIVMSVHDHSALPGVAWCLLWALAMYLLDPIGTATPSWHRSVSHVFVALAATGVGSVFFPLEYYPYTAVLGGALAAAAVLVLSRTAQRWQLAVKHQLIYLGAAVAVSLPGIAATVFSAYAAAPVWHRAHQGQQIQLFVPPSLADASPIVVAILIGVSPVVLTLLALNWDNKFKHLAIYPLATLVVWCVIVSPVPPVVAITGLLAIAVAAVVAATKTLRTTRGQYFGVVFSASAMGTAAILWSWNSTVTFIPVTCCGVLALLLAAIRFPVARLPLTVAGVFSIAPVVYAGIQLHAPGVSPWTAVALGYASIALGSALAAKRWAHCVATPVLQSFALLALFSTVPFTVITAALLITNKGGSRLTTFTVLALAVIAVAAWACSHYASRRATACLNIAWVNAGFFVWAGAVISGVLTRIPALSMAATGSVIFAALLMALSIARRGHTLTSAHKVPTVTLSTIMAFLLVLSVSDAEPFGAAALLLCAVAAGLATTDHGLSTLERLSCGYLAVISSVTAVWWVATHHEDPSIEVFTWPIAVLLFATGVFTTLAHRLKPSIRPLPRCGHIALALALLPTAFEDGGYITWRTTLILIVSVMWLAVNAVVRSKNIQLLTPRHTTTLIITASVLLGPFTSVMNMPFTMWLWLTTSAVLVGLWWHSHAVSLRLTTGFAIAVPFLCVAKICSAALGIPSDLPLAALIAAVIAGALLTGYCAARSKTFVNVIGVIGATVLCGNTLASHLPDGAPMESWSLIIALSTIGVMCHPKLRSHSSSWVRYGPHIIALLVPSATVEVLDLDLVWDAYRLVYVVLFASVMVALGIRYRRQAPLVVGSLALSGTAITHGLTFWLNQEVNSWVTLAILGSVLLIIGTRIEQRVRDLQTMRNFLKTYN